MFSRLSCAFFVLASTMPTLIQTAAAQSNQDDLSPQAREILNLVDDLTAQDAKHAKLNQLRTRAMTLALTQQPGDLEIVNASIEEFPHQRLTVFAFKVLDVRTGEAQQLLLDDAGQPLDEQEIQRNERQAFKQQFGQIHPGLHAKMANAPAAKQNVVIWLSDETNAPRTPRPDFDKKLSKQQIDALAAQIEDESSRHNERITGPMRSQLTRIGITAQADKFSPALFAQLDGPEIDRVSNMPGVQMVFPDEVNEPMMGIARQVIGASIVNARGYSGSGVKVAEVEVGGGVNTANPYLAGTTQYAPYQCLSGHSVAVAGCIRSTHGTDRGIAPYASLFVGGSCGGSGSELQSVATAGANWGASVVTNSWGYNSAGPSPTYGNTPNADAKFFDGMVINRWKTVVFAAGNRGGAEGAVINPAIAYNVIAVGATDDRNTLWTGDDLIASFSSWRNPTSAHGDRQKPEVVAPGTNIVTTGNVSPWTGWSWNGTSFAAPIAAGAAALIIQRNSSLAYWPESVKAIMMATALQNVDGYLGQSARLSEYDGAGGINADRADDVVRNGSWLGRSYDCSQPASLDVATIYLTAYKRTRICMVWDTDPNYASYTTQPSADLDLNIVSPTGIVTTGSYSYDNTFEIVDFTPSVSGYFKIRVAKYRCDMSPRYLGAAWYQVP